MVQMSCRRSRQPKRFSRATQTIFIRFVQKNETNNSYLFLLLIELADFFWFLCLIWYHRFIQRVLSFFFWRKWPVMVSRREINLSFFPWISLQSSMRWDISTHEMNIIPRINTDEMYEIYDGMNTTTPLLSASGAGASRHEMTGSTRRRNEMRY